MRRSSCKHTQHTKALILKFKIIFILLWATDFYHVPLNGSKNFSSSHHSISSLSRLYVLPSVDFDKMILILQSFSDKLSNPLK